MSDPEKTSEFREDVKALVRKHDPDTNQVRALADDLHDLANQWETLEEKL